MPVDGKSTQCALPMADSLPLALRNPSLDVRKPCATNEPDQALAALSVLTKLPYEILEAILLHLPIRDLLLSQLVCHRFREMVVRSKPIRRALFLEPAHHNGQLGDWRLLRFNPFLTDQLAGSFHTRAIGVHRSKEGTVKMVAHMRYEKEALLDDDWAEILLYEHASWKSMLVCACRCMLDQRIVLTEWTLPQVTQPPATLLMSPSAGLFWKTAMENKAQFYRDDAGFTIMDALDCADW